MMTPSINSLSTNYLQPTSLRQPANTGRLSNFSQLISTPSSAAPAGSTTSSSNPNQLFNQLMSSFQANSTEDQGQSTDPLSVF
jgi:hypothetical protein